MDGRRCALGRQSCNASQCCEGPGLQCYEQDASYAQCRPSCVVGPDPTHWDGKSWSCRELGPRAGGTALPAQIGQDCSEAQACAIPGFQCYRKNDEYATCKVTCAPDGPDLTDTDGLPWSCEKLGERAPTVQPWVSGQCSETWDSCLDTKCCKLTGHRCYKQNNFYAACRPEGTCPGESWSCEALGSATPAVPLAGGKMSPWVLEQCAKPAGDCTSSRCCLGMDMQCYEKDEFYAQCRQKCVRGEHASDGNDTWSCRELGPRSYGLAIKGFPSMFCFAVVRLQGYEVGLVDAQHKRGAGIFDCDGHAILTADGKATVGGRSTLEFGGAAIVNSVDNTAGNTELFVHAWRRVVDEGQWKDYAFTVKADADCVFFPQRLRWHLGDFVAKRMFVVNCPKWNMIYGALEVFSHSAIAEWARRGGECEAPANFGEDKYMTQCMDFLKVRRVRDDNVLADKLCSTFTTCDNTQNAAFHPFKDEFSWMQCWDTATKAMETAMG